MPNAPELSIVVPAHNEAGNVAALAGEIAAALEGRSYEMIFVDDRSTDATLDELKDAKSRFPALRVLSHRKNSGQSRSLRTGILHARGRVIGTLDGDGQNPPADLPLLIDALLRDDAPDTLKMVGGRRTKRKDSAWKKFASSMANGVRKSLLNDDADDTGCGLKAFYRDAYLMLPFFDHQHRFLPALMKREGYLCEFRDVSHRPRGAGQSKYTNFGRLFASLADMIGMIWLNARSRNPGGADEV